MHHNYVNSHVYEQSRAARNVEGASQGQGLGDRFLGHIERTNALLHLIDCTQDDIVEAYTTIRNELKEYGHGLDNKEEIIAVNKADALGPELAEDQARTLSEAVDKPVHSQYTTALSHRFFTAIDDMAIF